MVKGEGIKDKIGYPKDFKTQILAEQGLGQHQEDTDKNTNRPNQAYIFGALVLSYR